MKKILMFLFVGIIALTMTSCEDKQIVDNTVNVYFFTANTGAERVDTIFNIEPGSKIPKPKDPVRPGFAFLGWTTDLKGEKIWDFDTDTIGNTSIILYAKWEDRILTIQYHLNGGEMATSNYPVEFKPGDTFVLPAAKKTGYKFKGWYTYEPDFVKYPNTDGTKPGDLAMSSIPRTQTDDLVLYAHWELIKVTVQFRSNHPNGISVAPNPQSKVIAYTDVVVYGDNFPTFGTVAGYEFLGWNTKSDGTGEFVLDGSMFGRTNPITLYGIWKEI